MKIDVRHKSTPYKVVVVVGLIFSLLPSLFADQSPVSFDARGHHMGERSLEEVQQAQNTQNNAFPGDFLTGANQPLQPIAQADEAKTFSSLKIQGQSCSSEGDMDYHDTLCKWSYADGSRADVTIHGETHGNEYKRQIQIQKFNSDGRPGEKTTIREKQFLVYQGNKRLKEKVLIDVVNRPENGLTTREFYTYKYDLNNQQKISSTWTYYDKIQGTTFASLTYHVDLEFDKMGAPVKGKAERYKDGNRIAKYFEWDKNNDGVNRFDNELWQEWQTKTENPLIQEILKKGSPISGASTYL